TAAVETFESKSRAKLHLMSEKWRWHSFLADLQRGACDAALNRVAASVGSAAIDFCPMTVPVGIEHPISTAMEEYRFDYTPTTFHCVHKPARAPRNAIAGAEHCGNPHELASFLRALNDEWLWVDLVVGARLSIATTDDQRQGAVTVKSLWT